MHVGSVAILDPTKSPYGPLTLEMMTRFYRERLHLMPTARRRLVNVPFGLDRPYWIEDGDFDLEYHLREVGLPEPHDWRQFYTLAARILSRPLDMTRPLWEAYLIHGLDRLENIAERLHRAADEDASLCHRWPIGHGNGDGAGGSHAGDDAK